MYKQTQENSSVIETTVDRKLQHLKTQKKAEKTRFAKAKNALSELVKNQAEARVSKTKIRFAIKRMTSEFDIIENIFKQMKAIVTVEDVQGEIINVDEFIESLDKEMSEISTQVEHSVETAERHLAERIENGEQETMSHISPKSYASGIRTVGE